VLLDKRPEKSRHYMAILQREVNRLESLIEALLMLSRLDQNREKISFVRSDLNELLRQVVSDREALASAKSITLVLEEGIEPVIVEAD
jgi:signal transduction histidine kinase